MDGKAQLLGLLKMYSDDIRKLQMRVAALEGIVGMAQKKEPEPKPEEGKQTDGKQKNKETKVGVTKTKLKAATK